MGGVPLAGIVEKYREYRHRLIAELNAGVPKMPAEEMAHLTGRLREVLCLPGEPVVASSTGLVG